MKLFNSKTLLVVLACIVIFFGWLLYDTQVRLFNYKSQVEKFDLKTQVFTQKLLEDSTKLAEQDQVILTQKDAIRLGLLEIENIKKVKSKVKTITEIQIDSIIVRFTDTLKVSDTIYQKGIIKVPKRFLVAKDNYTLGGVIRTKDILFDSLLIPNTVEITIGYKDNGFLKKSTPIVEVTNSNPYLNIVDMNNVITKENKRFYQKPIFWAGVGLLGGIIIAK